MWTVAFDLGGVLRPVYLPGAAERNWSALQAMYSVFVESPHWRVVITSRRPLEKMTAESIKKELFGLRLPQPDEILVCSGSKTDLYREVKPDLVIDDSADHIRQALSLGITTLSVE